MKRLLQRLWRPVLLLAAFAGLAPAAHAVPAFAQQTGEACESCHVGAFGPQLKPYGRDFKLYGYTASDGNKHLPTIALTLQSSFTRTADDQPANVLDSLHANDNVLLDQQISLYFGGAITSSLGAFIQTTYDGQNHQLFLDNTDIRYARLKKLFGADIVVGLTLNNSPTVQDLWNSTPVWGFPYNQSAVAPSPASATLIDGGLAGQVAGLGAYALWNDWIYGEVSAYQGISARGRNALGTGPQQGAPGDVYDGLLPYWRFALEHEFGDHYLELGVLGLAGDRFPGGDRSAGASDHLSDRAVDVTWQYTGSENHYLSAHAIWIREAQTLGASSILAGTNPGDRLTTARADLSYSFRNSWTPSVQVFQTSGSFDPALWGTASGSPNSRGTVFELAYVPLGHEHSAVKWLNFRISLQYVAYSRFDGSTVGASGNNTLYLSLWTALAPFYAFEPRP